MPEGAANVYMDGVTGCRAVMRWLRVGALTVWDRIEEGEERTADDSR